MTFDRNAPYNDLPLLPPPYDLETKVVLKQAIGANRALANLRQMTSCIALMPMRMARAVRIPRKCSVTDRHYSMVSQLYASAR